MQLEKALQTVYGVDTQLISDGTYFAAEADGSPGIWRETSRERLCWSGAAGGASGRLCLVAISLRRGRIRCLIRQPMRQRFAHFLCIRHGRGEALGERFWRPARRRRGGWVSATGDGGYADRRSVLSSEGLCGVGSGGSAVGGWADATDCADGEEGGLGSDLVCVVKKHMRVFLAVIGVLRLRRAIRFAHGPAALRMTAANNLVIPHRGSRLKLRGIS